LLKEAKNENAKTKDEKKKEQTDKKNSGADTPINWYGKEDHIDVGGKNQLEDGGDDNGDTADSGGNGGDKKREECNKES
jgi:hypothetical protein